MWNMLRVSMMHEKLRFVPKIGRSKNMCDKGYMRFKKCEKHNIVLFGKKQRDSRIWVHFSSARSMSNVGSLGDPNCPKRPRSTEPERVGDASTVLQNEARLKDERIRNLQEELEVTRCKLRRHDELSCELAAKVADVRLLLYISKVGPCVQFNHLCPLQYKHIADQNKNTAILALKQQIHLAKVALILSLMH